MLWLAMSGSSVGVELTVGIVVALFVIGERDCIGLPSGAVVKVDDGIAVGSESFLIGEEVGSSISIRLTVCPVSVYVALTSKPQSMSSES